VTDSNAAFFFTQGGLSHAAPRDAQTDPFTLYDPLVQRFIVGEVDFQVDSSNDPVNNGGNLLLLAVSKTNNPSTLTKADWFFYEINTAEPGVALLDYPGNPGYNAVASLFGQMVAKNPGKRDRHVAPADPAIGARPMFIALEVVQTPVRGEVVVPPA
jgi:hypothetical protein